MQVAQIGAAFAAADPTAAGAWFAEHLGFEVLVDLGWYVSTKHSDRETVVDFVQHDHDTWPTPTGGGVRGALLGLLVDDLDAHHERMVAAGVTVLRPLATEPWGQRRFQVAGPDGLVVEILQRVAPDPEWMAAQGLG